MRLKAVVLENFRSYRSKTRIEIGDLTAFIGKNDAGKSSILEALDIFFGDSKANMEQGDCCIRGTDSTVRIGCVFTDLPDTLTLDATSSTTLKDERLLNDAGDLEVHKVYNCALKTPNHGVVACAIHPTAEGAADLLQLNRNELKQRVNNLSLDTNTVNLSNNADMRRAIRKHVGNLQLQPIDVPLGEVDGKKAWETLEKQMPVFALFRADRPSEDQDSEVQDPMKAAVKTALLSVRDKLADIEQEVKDHALRTARATLAKLREMDPGLAQDLTPEFREDPKWAGIFKLMLNSNDGIPMNKRGSGVRRLILLSFFRAEAEREQEEQDAPGVIYAIEELETSQHPDNQRMLIDIMSDLAEQEGRQVIITTHVPGLAGMLPVATIRYVKKQRDGDVLVADDGKDMYRSVAEGLGVVPDNRLKVFVCVEGTNDVAFFRHISHTLQGQYTDLPDLSSDPRFAVLPLGGQTLVQWVQKNYLGELGRPEVHIYDRDMADPPEYQATCDEVNEREDSSCGFLTGKREIENYIHQQAIEDELHCQVEVTDRMDVPEAVARATHEAAGDSKKPWEELSDDKRSKKVGRAKRRLNHEVAASMTVEQIEEMDPEGEIKAWLQTMAELADQP